MEERMAKRSKDWKRDWKSAQIAAVNYSPNASEQALSTWKQLCFWQLRDSSFFPNVTQLSQLVESPDLQKRVQAEMTIDLTESSDEEVQQEQAHEQQKPNPTMPVSNTSIPAGEHTVELVTDPVTESVHGQIHEASDTDTDKGKKKLAKELWNWYRLIDMQAVSHIGDEETDQCWKQLEKVKSVKDLIKDPELLNLVAALRQQYLSGFTGKAQR